MCIYIYKFIAFSIYHFINERKVDIANDIINTTLGNAAYNILK